MSDQQTKPGRRRTYLVGGAVRDELLGREVRERDWVVTGADPDELINEGFKRVGNDFPVFISPESGEEYALARTERKQGVGHTDFICEFGPEVTLEEDLRRRDLTVNAIAKDPKGQLIDPWNGQADIERRILRHVSEAFAEDPLRVLRVARFAAQLAPWHFQVAPETELLLKRMCEAGELASLTPERVWLETRRALASPDPNQYFALLANWRALEVVMPIKASNWLETWGAQAFASRQNTGRALLPEQIYALLFAGLQGTDATTEKRQEALAVLREQLKVPNRYHQLALKVVSCLSLNDPHDTDQITHIFERTGLYHNLDQFMGVLEVACQLARAAGWDWSEDLLQTCARAAAAVTGGDFLKEGLQGRALGRHLKAQRQAAIAEVIKRANE